MSAQRWTIVAPEEFAYTPAEIAQIGKAAQAFLDAAAGIGGVHAVHLVTLSGIGVIDGDTRVDWPQPREGVLINPLVTTKADGASAQ